MTDESDKMKEAIIDLYLAIKIRSSDEVITDYLTSKLDQITEDKLHEEKEKLVENDCF